MAIGFYLGVLAFVIGLFIFVLIVVGTLRVAPNVKFIGVLAIVLLVVGCLIIGLKARETGKGKPLYAYNLGLYKAYQVIARYRQGGNWRETVLLREEKTNRILYFQLETNILPESDYVRAVPSDDEDCWWGITLEPFHPHNTQTEEEKTLKKLPTKTN